MNKTKVAIFAIVGILLVSSSGIALGTVTARPSTMDNLANRLTQASWVRLNGIIDQWGELDVRGQLHVQTRSAIHETSDAKQYTSVTAMWTESTTRAIQSVRAKENFTYVYYVARLPNASVSTVTIADGNYLISGLWNLSNITSTITVITDDDDGTITRVHRDQDIITGKANGELTITGNEFTLQIDQNDALTGSIYRSIMRSWHNPFKMSDDASTNTITRTDVRTIAQCYGAMPGWGNYDTSMDFNNNYRVDIADISAVASSM